MTAHAKSYPCPNCGRVVATQQAYVRHLLEEAGERGVEESPNALLTNHQVAQMRRLRATGLLQRELAERFGISRSAVSNILRGRSY